MVSIISRISDELHVPEEDLVSDSVSSFLEKELESANSEIEDIKKEFKVSDKEELERKIKSGDVEENPAWEKIIYWENLESRINAIKKWVRELNTKS